MTRVHRLHLTPADQAAQRYLPVPFEVPAGADSLEVRLAYDTSAGVVDLGCEGADGWRGWSGGARARFAITPDAATPGYVPGRPEAGEWAVVLGLHKIPADGLDVVVEIDVPASGPVEETVLAPVADTPRGSSRGLPAPAGLTWFAGDFHAHTLHSDGSESIDQLAARGVASGLDFLAVTDHNTVSHHAHLPGVGARHGISLVPGQEVTTARGHANAFGDIGWIDFRRPGQDWVDDVAARGGVLSINHPVDGDCAWLHPLERLPVALELWHISWYRDLAASFPWAFWARWGELAGQGVTPIGGSDFHSPGAWTVGIPTTWVLAEDASPEAILAGVANGRTAIGVGARVTEAGPVVDPLRTPLLLRPDGSRGADGELLALGADGAALVDVDGRRTILHGDAVSVPASWGRGPFHLADADRRILALSP
ncbi:PHP domain protein [Beutenbergia cavernae DSM 12333]|uniref:PHP domain protein n=1 Tax=Beutenbergia cavernae (strain ATCC BAA-8 / DSM 12333 / CCUG 43141 / JCM 11478 / NBRC 16432 / NCIMB 13614 / HKI 0122) TaxID=471853 RepID=C5BWY5_BEUC1|nr:CehA/McbA family metallohydrolase [Beutenbergia cavernae]ACQ80801.1 PHP domain protein [Beutenbergia cavernae DSM 12333]